MRSTKKAGLPELLPQPERNRHPSIQRPWHQHPRRTRSRLSSRAPATGAGAPIRGEMRSCLQSWTTLFDDSDTGLHLETVSDQHLIAPGQLSPGRANARRYALTARPVGRGSLRARSPGRRSPTTLMLPIAAARCPTRLALPSFGLILHCTRRRLSGPGFMAACRLHAKNLFAQNRRTTS